MKPKIYKCAAESCVNFFLITKRLQAIFSMIFFTRNLSYDQKKASLISDVASAVQWSADRMLGSDSKSSEFESCNQFFFFTRTCRLNLCGVGTKFNGKIVNRSLSCLG